MDREKIGHDQDHELLQLLVSKTENSLERIKEAIETKDYSKDNLFCINHLDFQYNQLFFSSPHLLYQLHKENCQQLAQRNISFKSGI